MKDAQPNNNGGFSLFDPQPVRNTALPQIEPQRWSKAWVEYAMKFRGPSQI